MVSRPFGGLIDDVLVYKRVLSAAEINDMYQDRAVRAAKPAGTEGQIVYSSSQNVPMYCNGTNWVAMGQLNR